MKLLDFIASNNVGEATTMEFRAKVEDYNEIEFLINSTNKGKYEINLLANNNFPNIKKVIFNKPATIVLWEDGTKTVVKCSDKDIWNPEKGLAMCLIKKICGNDNSYHKIFKKWIPEDEYEFFKEALHLLASKCIIPIPLPPQEKSDIVMKKKMIENIEVNNTLKPIKPNIDEKYIKLTNDYYDKLSKEDGYIKVSELVERFKEIDDYCGNSGWSMLQILVNINMFIPISKEEIITEAFNED